MCSISPLNQSFTRLYVKRKTLSLLFIKKRENRTILIWACTRANSRIRNIIQSHTELNEAEFSRIEVRGTHPFGFFGTHFLTVGEIPYILLFFFSPSSHQSYSKQQKKYSASFNDTFTDFWIFFCSLRSKKKLEKKTAMSLWQLCPLCQRRQNTKWLFAVVVIGIWNWCSLSKNNCVL